jgi:hypothetical protein
MKSLANSAQHKNITSLTRRRARHWGVVSKKMTSPPTCRHIPPALPLRARRGDRIATHVHHAARRCGGLGRSRRVRSSPTGCASDDAEGQLRLAAFQGLQQLSWSVGGNVRIDYRWGAGDADRFRRYAAELVALAPDVILATSGTTVPWLLQATRSVPIVFTQTPDPVGAGFVASLAHPGGNITGFINFEYSIGGKFLELLKEIAPRVTRPVVQASCAYDCKHTDYIFVLDDHSLDCLGLKCSGERFVRPKLQIDVHPVQEASNMGRAVTHPACDADDRLGRPRLAKNRCTRQ